MHALARCGAEDIFERGQGFGKVFGEGAGDGFEVGEANLRVSFSHVERVFVYLSYRFCFERYSWGAAREREMDVTK